MGSINKVILIGRCAADPEVRRTNDGRSICNLRVVTSETWRDKATGERKEKSEFHRVVIFNEGLSKIAEQYLKKGSQLYLEGQLQTRKWTDQSGADKYSTEVVLQNFGGQLVLLDSPPKSAAGEYEDKLQQAREVGRTATKRKLPAEELDDMTPF